MFEDKIISALKDRKNTEKLEDKEIFQAMAKIKKQKRLSSQEFLKVYNTLWQEGPTIQYQNPDVRVREHQSLNNTPDP